MRLLIVLLVAVGVAVSSNLRLEENTTASDPQAVSVAYHQILEISKAVRRKDTIRFIKLVLKAKENPKNAEPMMRKWALFTLFVQWAKYDGADKIEMSGEFNFNDKHLTGRFIFEKRTNDWVLTDFPPLLLSIPTEQMQIFTTEHLSNDSQYIVYKSLHEMVNMTLEEMRGNDVKN